MGNRVGHHPDGDCYISGCTRSIGDRGETAANSNSSKTQSSSESQKTTEQQSVSSSVAKSNAGTKATVSDGVQTLATTLDRGIYKVDKFLKPFNIK